MAADPQPQTSPNDETEIVAGPERSPLADLYETPGFKEAYQKELAKERKKLGILPSGEGKES